MMQHLTSETLLDYIHGELSPPEDASVYAHIEQCEPCRAEYQAEVSFGEMLRANAAREERELPSSVKAHIWQQIREAKPSPLGRFSAWLRPALLIPTAAALAIAAYFGTSFVNPHGAPAIEASYYLQDHAAMNTTIPFSDRTTVNPVDLENAAAVDTQQTAVNVQAASYTADANP